MSKHPRTGSQIRQYVGQEPLQKRLTLVTRPRLAFPETLPEGGSAAAPTVQGGSARESHPGTPNWSPLKPPPRSKPGWQPEPAGEAARPPQPVLRCKRRSQLPRNSTPVRPHVLHPLPCRYGEGDVNAVADGTDPPAGDAVRTSIPPVASKPPPPERVPGVVSLFRGIRTGLFTIIRTP